MALAKLLVILSLVATSCLAQAPSGSPPAAPVAAPLAFTPSPTSSPGPFAGKPSPSPLLSPASASGAATPSSSASLAGGPAVDQSPNSNESNNGFVSRVAVGGTALVMALVAMALMSVGHVDE